MDTRSDLEKDTLVVDVVGFNEGSWIDMVGDPHTDRLHLVERFTRKDLYTLRYEATTDDPGAYIEPWTIAFDMFVWDDKGEIQVRLPGEQSLDAPPVARWETPAGKTLFESSRGSMT